ncbi:serine--tRNA ligase [Candidatus Dependentiae bacterium]
MIDLSLLRDNPAHVIELLKKKDPGYDAQLLFDLDKKVKSVKIEVEDLRHKKNELAKKGRQGITDELRQQSKQLGKDLKEKEVQLQELEVKFKDLYLRCPNIPQEDVPSGGKAENKVVKEFGKKPTFSFAIQDHIELGERLGWLDFEVAAKIAGSNFAFYKGDAVKLQYALTMYMLKNNMANGYDIVLPPYLVNEKSLLVSGNFPKFRDQVYEVKDQGLFLTPTAEVDLASVYRDKILSAEQLPLRMTAWTSCFRSEAGAYGAAERGLIRIHQFEKVELFALSEPEHSQDELDRMIASAEAILQKLGLHYRVSLLAAQDCSFPSAKTYDIEVWMPARKEYYEVSSCSNCTDFQARRGLIRYRKSPDSKPSLLYTLNGSSLALPRLLVAIMETYQQEDGSIAIPEFLKKEALFS